MKNALIIEDHTVVRMGMKLLLQEVIPDIAVMEADSFPDGMCLVKQHQIDIVILDISISGGAHTQMIPLIRNFLPSCKVLIFSALDEEKYALRYLQAGANGYLSKKAPHEDYVEALNALIRNERYVSHAIHQSILMGISSNKRKSAAASWKSLSGRETEITKLLIQGMWTKQIANTLTLKESTVSTFKRKIFEKVGVSNVMELARKISEREAMI